MPNTAKVDFNVSNLTQQVSTPAKGITYMGGPTELGPEANPETVIKSWAAFKKTFGGLVDGNNFPLICKRALDGGASLRISRSVHYTDPSDPSTNDGVDAVLAKWMTITFDAALITDNVVNITIGGVAMLPETFATDSDTTMAAVATALAAMSNVTSAKVIEVGAGSDREILITFPNLLIINTYPTVDVSTVTLGISQAGITDAVALNPWTNDEGESLFTLSAKYQGAGYNAFRVVIENASNGQADYFNLKIYSAEDSTILETYKNLTIPLGGQTVILSTYLDEIENNSKYLTITYNDTTAPSNSLYPNRMDQQLDTGTDGTAPALADYIGDSAGGTGLYSFDDYDDGMQMMFPNLNGWDFHNSAAAYVIVRGDMQYNAWAGDDEDAATLITNRTAYPVDTKLVNAYYGLIQVIHPITGLKYEMSPMGDIAAAIANSDNNFGEWFSYAGVVRGVLPGVLKVMNNFGTPGSKDGLQLISQNQVNAVIQRSGKIFISGNFTTQTLDDTEKFTNVTRFILFLQRSLGPTLESFLEDPNDPSTWNKIYYTVMPFLDNLLNQRAMFSYEWQGDQNVASIDDVQINDPVDVANGIYKINLIVQPIAALQEISVNIILTAGSGISFETETA